MAPIESEIQGHLQALEHTEKSGISVWPAAASALRWRYGCALDRCKINCIFQI